MRAERAADMHRFDGERHTIASFKPDARYGGAKERINKALVAVMSGRPRDALPILEDVLREFPDLIHAHVNIANAFGMLGRGKEAEKHYRKALALEPGNVTALCGMASWYKNNDDFAAAAEWSGRVLEKNPNHLHALCIMGDAAGGMAKYKEALEYFERAAAAESGDPYPGSRAAEMLVVLGRNAEALERMRDVVDANPDDAETRLKMGIFYSRLGRKREAVDEYMECVKLDPGKHMAYANIGIEIANAGEVAEGAEYLRKAVEIEPKYAYGHATLSTMLHALGEYDEALKHMKISTEIDPRYINDPYGKHINDPASGRAGAHGRKPSQRKAGKPRRPESKRRSRYP